MKYGRWNVILPDPPDKVGFHLACESTEIYAPFFLALAGQFQDDLDQSITHKNRTSGNLGEQGLNLQNQPMQACHRQKVR